MSDTPIKPGIWNYQTLGNANLTTDPIRTLPLCSSRQAVNNPTLYRSLRHLGHSHDDAAQASTADITLPRPDSGDASMPDEQQVDYLTITRETVA